MCSLSTLVPGDSAQCLTEWQQANKHISLTVKNARDGMRDGLESTAVQLVVLVASSPDCHCFCIFIILSCHPKSFKTPQERLNRTSSHLWRRGWSSCNHSWWCAARKHDSCCMATWPAAVRSSPFELNKAPLYSLLFLNTVLYKTLHQTL